ncbi:MAG: hypothetical protein GXY06_06905 [Clostridiaceae bacterium]|nr:hypothetical protein [Clostridiaceae bacterium]
MEAAALKDWDDIEYKYYGTNNSLVRSYASASASERGWIDIKQERRRMAAEAERLEKERCKSLLIEHRQKEHTISLKRAREAFFVILGICVATMMFASVLYMQAQITAMNYQNNSAQRRIERIQQETAQLKEAMIAAADLDQIRIEATERLGMQDPGAYQTVSLKLPGNDKLVSGKAYNKAYASSVDVEQAKEDLANYYMQLS